MKSKLYKSLACSMLGASMLTLGSCTDLSETIYSEQYEFSESDNQGQFATVYSSLRDFYWAWYGYADLDICTDLWCIPLRLGVGWGDLYISFHKHEFHAGLGHLSGLWTNGYAGITACNKLLDQTESLKLTDSQVAQLRAYRALYYYLLFDLFRNIPLETTFYNNPEGYQPKQATPQEMWDFIIGELNDVKNACGTDVKAGKNGEMNNYVVHMILAKMYLNHNAWFNNHSDNSYYEKCIDELETILAESQYQLAPNYEDNFKEDITTSPEIIFGIPFEYLYAGGNYFANLWMNEAGRATWQFTGWATGGGGALNQFLDTYKGIQVDPITNKATATDKRFGLCWIGGPQVDYAGEKIMVDGTQLNYTYNMRSIDNPGCYPMEGYRLQKYEILEGDWGSSYDDIPFFRLADAKMMKAECLLRLGGYKGETKEDAAELVTEVRRRAFDNEADAKRTVADLEGNSVYKYGYWENTAKQDESDNITSELDTNGDIELGGLLDDLAWEFVAEHHRRQDLIRFRLKNNPQQNVYNGKSWFCKKAITGNGHEADIFPIYRDILNGNVNLVQNPGYSE
ncbi:RagB/SusD family nutrient uptake outer membrane protein [Phocaeicola plebeius]|uniref:RagB/SusD family nutrient uptake outer membrane protein n=1 Tax=Phocaeicola plebeius TaxID=310297 RepID=A0A415IZG1_9BACT|nr:RagB/SusD family nutrient uptake outer membrane protein [Phocaeicola plebeius]RHK93067.1 RagB/SusD family nutrient uptake outer membrane protein [Phocaeicola plebeius]RHL13049.1 RagB/SusD family nutrient uptake outer membrane protein [Phocaeicola plebeius]